MASETRHCPSELSLGAPHSRPQPYTSIVATRGEISVRPAPRKRVPPAPTPGAVSPLQIGLKRYCHVAHLPQKLGHLLLGGPPTNGAGACLPRA